MKLDRDTYEAWLLDRMEGRLNAAQEAELEAFLRRHPELRPAEELLPTVQPSGEAFPGKEALYKQFPPTAMPGPANLGHLLVARMENDLPPAQLRALERYLYEHPEAKRQAELMGLAKISAAGEVFPGKEGLLRQFPPAGMPDAHRLTDFLIAEMEGDLTPRQEEALHLFVGANPRTAQERQRLRATKVPALAMRFPGKEQLKKQEGRVVPLWARLAAAASVLLLVGMGTWYLRHRTGDAVQVAQVKPAIPPQQPGPSPASGPGTAAAQPDRQQPKVTVAVQGQETPPGATAGSPAGAPRKPAATVLPMEQELPAPVRKEEPLTPLEQELPLANNQQQAPARDPENGMAQVHEAPLAAAGQAAPPKAGTSQTLGEFMANALRERVLKQPARNEAIDGDDALALADRALGAVSNGQAGMQVKQAGNGERIKLRIGRHFSISASRAR